ncbi:LysR family transcriptional regulator [Paeniglutamicibacter psychrophenolicus]|uniref:DNA-binding transcriptional LysR family regulator n=1 Tax=Paeniglutamicibacter psychrophenolicus TaxID=257454 RepID=A0ABS4WAF2_9MICC|nr:LysR family transcriptional regulator [Paeniglutamicibacter psychrophenolicus]MBP2373184.1 DNA-binding transcriptional LysR family regulator [Paeniglutamicibacter psychrophenolicus]
MLNLTHLRTLVAVVQLKSFTAAGNRLGYTASAVSQQMQALERDAGLILFLRRAQSIQPTEAAHTMARYAEQILRDVESMLAAGASASRLAVKELRIGIFPSLATVALPLLVKSPSWQSMSYELRISVAEPSGVARELLAGGLLDVGVTYQVADSPLTLPQGVNRTFFAEDKFRVVVPIGWLNDRNERLGITELGLKPWILHHKGSSDASITDELFMRAGIHPRIAAHSDDFNTTLRLVAAGYGAALVPDLALVDAPEGLGLVNVPELALSRNIFIVSTENCPSEAMDAFIQSLRDAYEVVMDSISS